MLNFLSKQTDKIRFVFGTQAENKKRLTWDDLETIEGIQNGETSSRGLRHLAARFMADDKNQYLPHDKALKILGALSAEDIQGVLQQFTEAMQAAAINPQKGNGLNSPSDPGQTQTFPDGL